MSQRHPRRPGFWLLWAIATLLILASEPRWLAETCRIFDARAEALLSRKSAWSPPLVRLAFIESIAIWPYWVFALTGGALIAGVCRRLRESAPLWLAAFVLVGLSLMMAPGDLIPAAFVLAATRMTAALPQPVRWQRAALTGVVFAVGSLMVTLEFSLVLMFLALLLEDRIWDQPRLRWRFAAGLTGSVIVGAALAIVVFPGLAAAAARPISAIWMRPAANVLPSLEPVFYDESQWLSQGLLLTFVVVCLFRKCVASRSVRPELLTLWLLALMGISCGRYFWICMFASAAAFVPRDWPDPLSRVNPLVIIGCLVLAIARHVPLSPHYADYFLNGTLLANHVDPAKWTTRGPVLLLDLDDSRSWQVPALERQFPLLIDDRWDSFGELYPTYAAVRHDLGEDRGDRYLRSDGSWGGYRRWIDDWSPALLVTPTTRVDEIRRLSMSPYWKIMGLDAERVIFGRSSYSPNATQFRRALATLTSLEWPGEQFSGVDSSVLVVSNVSDAVPVAGALCAMRFPYAALRILPADESPFAEEVRTWCYLELAHRARQHTGRASLLDQYRAVCGVRDLQSQSRLGATELLKFAGSLNGLALSDLAAEATGQVLKGGSKGGLLQSDRDLARALLVEAEQSPQGQHSHRDAPDNAEATIRAALQRGDSELCERSLSNLDGSVREFYGVLCSASNMSAIESCARLDATIQRPDFPARLHEEALFYLACLGIEAGNTGKALEALTAANPESPYQALQKFYLQQLRQH